MVDVLLSTYNGEKYLQELLDSLLSQTCKEWRLIVRDDGSKDSTADIIRDFKAKYNDTVLLLPDSGVNLGVIKSFERLLESSTSDYFMFCDQDDVWCKEKIEKSLDAVQKLEGEYGKELPMVAHTDLYIVDSQLNQISDSYFKWYDIDPDYIYSDIDRALLFNAIPGCTMIGNKAAKELSLPFNKHVLMHDAWIVRCALLNKGHLATIREPLIKYRQHSGNVVGASFKKIPLKRRILDNWETFCFFAHFAKAPILFRFIYTKLKFKLHR